LLARGDTVLSIDNLATGRRDNLTPQPRLTQLEGSIVDAAVIDELFSEFKPDVVVHTAASYKDPEDWVADALTNAVGGANIAKPARPIRSGASSTSRRRSATAPSQSSSRSASIIPSIRSIRAMRSRRRRANITCSSPASTG